MASMRELANHIIALANREDVNVTNLQIQKVMFFALGMHIRRNRGIDSLAEETYDIPFEKWQYGPVVESVYYRLNRFKARPIESEGTYSQEYGHWDETILNLLEINVFDLVKVSHDMSAWNDYKDDIINRRYVDPYTIEEIAGDFIHAE